MLYLILCFPFMPYGLSYLIPNQPPLAIASRSSANSAAAELPVGKETNGFEVVIATKVCVYVCVCVCMFGRRRTYILTYLLLLTLSTYTIYLPAYLPTYLTPTYLGLRQPVRRKPADHLCGSDPGRGNRHQDILPIQDRGLQRYWRYVCVCVYLYLFILFYVYILTPPPPPYLPTYLPTYILNPLLLCLYRLLASSSRHQQRGHYCQCRQLHPRN
jgi:hypothetical protein